MNDDRRIEEKMDIVTLNMGTEDPKVEKKQKKEPIFEINQEEQKPVSTDNVLIVKVPAPPMEELKKFAIKFAEAADVLDKFVGQINDANTPKSLDSVIKEIIADKKVFLENKGMKSEALNEWVEGMENIIDRTYGRAEKFGLKALDKALGEKGDLGKLFKSETAKESIKDIQEKLEKPLENIEWATLGISLALMLLQGGALISKGSVIKQLAHEIALMEKAMDKMPFGKARYDLENAIKSLKEQLTTDKSDLLIDVIGYAFDCLSNIKGIAKKSVGMILKTVAPKIAAAMGSKSVIFPVVGAAMLAAQKSYEMYRSVATQIGLKKFHLAAQKGEPTYDLTKKGTKQLYIKQEIEKEDKNFLKDFGSDNQQLIDTNPYKSATIVYDSLKRAGVTFEWQYEEILLYSGNKCVHTISSNDLKKISPELFEFIKAKIILDKMESKNDSKEWQKKYNSLLKKHDKLISNKKVQHKLLEGIKGLVEVIKEIKNDNNEIFPGVEKLNDSILLYGSDKKKEMKLAVSAEELYKQIVDVKIRGEKGYSLKSSQLISEGTFRKTYYLTSPQTVFGGRLLKIKISKEMHLFLKYQALKGELANAQGPEQLKIQKEIDKLKKDYEKIMKDPVKSQEVFDDFRAMLLNKSVRSAFIYNKVKGKYDVQIETNIKSIEKDVQKIKNLVNNQENVHLNTAEKAYDFLVAGSYLNDKVVMEKIKNERGMENNVSGLTKAETILKNEALSTPLEIDPARLSIEGKGKNVVYSFQNQNGKKIEVTQELYWFLKFRGNKNQAEAQFGSIIDESRLLSLFKEFINGDGIIDTLIHDAAVRQVGADLITKDLQGQDSILSKRANTEKTKIERAKVSLEEILKNEKLPIDKKLEKLNAAGFKLENLLHHDGDKWVLRGLKGEEDEKQEINEKDNIIDFEENSSSTKSSIAKDVGIDEELAKLISPKKVAEHLFYKKNIVNQKVIKKFAELKVNKQIENLQSGLEKAPEELKDRIKDVSNEISKLVNAYFVKDKNCHFDDVTIEIERKNEGIKNLKKELKISEYPKEIENKIYRLLNDVNELEKLQRLLLTLGQLTEEVEIYKKLPQDKSILLKVLNDEGVRGELAIDRGRGHDTRNTLFRQMAKVVKTEKLRQERVYNAHKARANFVGALGAVGGTVVGVLVVAGVIATSASVVGLAVLGFSALMIGVGLVILKVKKPQLFSALMRAVPFRIAFNKMKESWNSYHQKKIENKAYYDKAEVAMISVNATPKAEIDRFLQRVALDSGNLPPWDNLSAPMKKMIAGLNNMSLSKLEEDWNNQNKIEIKGNLIDKIQRHREPDKARKVAKSPIDDLILEVKQWKENRPLWKDLGSDKQKILAKAYTGDENLENIWNKSNSIDVLNKLNLKKSELNKKYKVYDKHVSRLERQQQRIIDLKTRNDLAAGNDFALKLAHRMGKKGPVDFNPAEMAWEELVAGGGIEDSGLVELFKHEMGIDVEKMLKDKKGLEKEVMKDDFVKAFNGFLALEGQAFVTKMENMEKKIQSSFAQPLKMQFDYYDEDNKKVI